MRATIFANLLVSAQIAVFGQAAASRAPDPKIQFEVASVKISPPIVGNTRPALMGTRGGPGTADPGQFTLGYASMKTVLVQAFGVKALQISGPAWHAYRGGSRWAQYHCSSAAIDLPTG